MANSWLSYCETFKDAIKARHKQMLGRECNLDNPTRFTDKLEWLKIYDSTFLKTYCADKYTARRYVATKLGKDISIPIIGVYNNFSDINFGILPQDYVIKTNHGSHTILIVRNGNINKLDAARKFSDWLSKDWSWYGYELHYIPIPRKIIIEPFMQSGDSSLIDYKFYCFNGQPHSCQVIMNRGSNETISHYDMNWKYQPIYERPDCLSVQNLKRPNEFNTMYSYAKQLSADFKFVRVDFYIIKNVVYFGELTFIPAAAYLNYKDDTADRKIGDLLNLKG